MSCAVHGNKSISTHWQEFRYQDMKQVQLSQSQCYCHGTKVLRKRAHIQYPGEAMQFNYDIRPPPWLYLCLFNVCTLLKLLYTKVECLDHTLQNLRALGVAYTL